MSAKTEKKGFFKQLIEKIDKKMQEKANQTSCCQAAGKSEDKGKKTSCCG